MNFYLPSLASWGEEKYIVLKKQLNLYPYIRFYTWNIVKYEEYQYYHCIEIYV